MVCHILTLKASSRFEFEQQQWHHLTPFMDIIMAVIGFQKQSLKAAD